MSPFNTPPHSIPSDPYDAADDQDYILEEEAYNIVSDHDEEPISGNIEDEGSDMEDLEPIKDDCILLLKQHAESVFCVDIHPMGQYIASGAQDHTAIVWDANTASAIFTCTGHEDSVTSVNFSPDGRYLATGDMSGVLIVWRQETDKEGWTQHTTVSMGDLLWLKWWRASANKPQVLLAGSEDGTVAAALITGKAQEKSPKYLAGPGSAAIAADVVPSTVGTDRPYLAVMYRGGDFRVWDLKTEQPVVSASLPSAPLAGDAEGDMDMEGATGGFICMAAPKPNNNPSTQDIVAVGTFEKIVILPCKPPTDGNMACKKLMDNTLTQINLESAGTVEAMDFSWTHLFLAFGTVNGEIGIYDVSSGRMRQKWTYTESSYDTYDGVGITALKWSKSEPIFFTSSLAGTVVAWAGLPREPMTGIRGKAANPLAIWRGHSEAVLDFALSPLQEDKPAYLVSASDDATLRIFSLANIESAA